MAILMIGGLLALLPSLASAHPVSAPAPSPATADCPLPSLFTPLAAFGDTRSYFVAAGGDFESPGWKLAGGATLTAGGGPLRLGAAKASLKLPPGGSATSPTFCVDLDYPTFRFFHARGASPLSVDVLYPALGAKKPKAASVSGGSTSWKLSKDVSLRPERVTRDWGWRYVQLRFVAATGAKGDWLVDDVLVDPRMRG